MSRNGFAFPVKFIGFLFKFVLKLNGILLDSKTIGKTSLQPCFISSNEKKIRSRDYHLSATVFEAPLKPFEHHRELKYGGVNTYTYIYIYTCNKEKVRREFVH